MAFNHTLSAIMRGQWLLDKQWADAHLPLLVMMLKGQPVSFAERTGNQGYERPFCINPATMERIDNSNPNIPPNSVGVIPMSGPITKYNGDCGEYGAIAYNAVLGEMGKNQNVGSVVIISDTPGGEARAANTLNTSIAKFQKPILTWVDGMCASLGVWFSSPTDEVYLSNATDQIGSIGSYCTLFDFREALEMAGIKMTEIYAPQSVDKNKDYRDAIDGDTSMIEADLKIHVDAFIKSVASSGGRNTMRSDTARTNIKEWSTGKMFYAADAVRVGLADGVKSLEQVVSKAAWLAKRKK